MCLIDYKKIDVSEKTGCIKCYKVLKTDGGVFYSPLFSKTSWEIGGKNYIYEKRPVFRMYGRSGKHGLTYVQTIMGNCFHSFKKLEDAKQYKIWLGTPLWRVEKVSLNDFVIVECEIPRDTAFAYEGISVKSFDDEGFPAYVSQSLRVLKIVG